ncbi:putative comG operon protein ComGA [Listeria weihenstephanensis FSL R9-0317]|uniref:General secretion pathway protein GspE n=1 Tax=Listeria weihenstephanensis TaxID=1006155 RepID=A0A1S7FUH5_9LIST|nr:competence type IV pilus ATPase ComGA [Listeria weihenstephanensis]AQY51101.1 general secretion pathway protein GspE [Listeria weihenstephanensis]EUJ36524.1 putative comG operon protein ComGA [Listeria weihenstephanensis FSL R9-0317]
MIQELANALLNQSMLLSASDIHLIPYEANYRILFRINGRLQFFHSLTLDKGERLLSHLKYRGFMDISETRKPQSGSFQALVHDNNVSVRLATIPNFRFIESMVIRVFSEQKIIPFCNSTVFHPIANQILSSAKHNTGLLLFSGSTGSGKTSSMYSLAHSLSQEEPLQVITIEDPVERPMSSFLQVQINEKAGLDYAEIIRATLRHDPDILIVGEIRDTHTAKMVIRSALTGHLVLSTVHADNTYGVLSRLLELGVDKEELRQCLIGISYQQLKDLHCIFCERKCHTLCNHLPRKRTALYEFLEKENINQFFSTTVEQTLPNNIAHQIKKGGYYGFFSPQ